MSRFKENSLYGRGPMPIFSILTILFAAFPAFAAPANPVKVMSPIPFEDTSGASGKVKSECELQLKVPQFLSSYSKQVKLVKEDPGTEGRVLQLTITSVTAPGGGAWSGAKFMTVEGVLLEDGEEIGDFVASRYSGGGAFAGFKGTCSIIGRCAKAIGKDIAVWLKDPQKESRLGDAH